MSFYSENIIELSRIIDKCDFVRARYMLTNHATKLLLGKGVSAKFAKENLQNKWIKFMKDNRIEDIIYAASEIASNRGFCPVGINIDNNGDPFWTLPNPDFACVIGRNRNNEETAIFYDRIIVDNKNYFIVTEYTTQYIKRRLFDKESQSEVTSYYNVMSKLPKEQQVPEVYYHNLGFCPVGVIYNKPYYAFYETVGSPDYFSYSFINNITTSESAAREIKLADWYPSINLEVMLNIVIRQTAKESLYAKSRIIMDELPQVLLGGANPDPNNQDSVIVQQYAEATNDFLIRNQGGGALQVQQNKNQLNDYMNFIQNFTAYYFNVCGYSYKQMSSAQKTSTESSAEYAQSIETTNAKRVWHNKYWTRIIEKTFMIWGIDLTNEEWKFEIQKNIALDEAGMRDALIKDVQAGAKTIPDYISQVEGVSKEQAAVIFKENKKWFTENDFPIAMKDGGGAMSGVNGASLPGRPQDNKEKPANDKHKSETK